MAESGILSDLCSACHIQTPKYKCPRCSTRTCSLTCSKLHKERAQCSGVRDPTAFIKKSQLTTPAGFDHDFNFLSKLEREMQEKEESVRFSNIAESEEPVQRSRQQGRFRQPQDRGEQFRRKAKFMGVTVHSAPKGMLRQRQNESRVGRKSNQIIWSIEWVTEDDASCITTIPHPVPLGIAFRTAAALLKLPHAELPSKKRKREVAVMETMEPTDTHLPKTTGAGNNHSSHIDVVTLDTITGQGNGQDTNVPAAAVQANDEIDQKFDGQLEQEANKIPAEPSSPDVSPIDKNDQEALLNDNDDDANSLNDENQKTAEEGQEVMDNMEAEADAITDTLSESQPDDQSPYFFYLVRVKTGHPKRVLIPVDATHSVGDILRGQVVLEFPTIQILTHSPEAIGDKYILEQDWKIDFAEQEAELRALAASEDVVIEESNPNNIPITNGRIPNGADLMAILQQDIID